MLLATRHLSLLLRFAICDLRSAQFDSCFHLKLPMTEAGECVTPEVGRRPCPPMGVETLSFACRSHSSLVTAFAICDLRRGQFDSCFHLKLPITEVGECVTPEVGRRPGPHCRPRVSNGVRCHWSLPLKSGHLAIGSSGRFGFSIASNRNRYACSSLSTRHSSLTF